MMSVTRRRASLRIVVFYVAVPYAGGEPGYLLQQGFHRCTTASGRTGEPVPPTILSGARTNSELVHAGQPRAPRGS